MDEDYLLALQLQGQFDCEYDSLISPNVHNVDNEFGQSDKKRKVDGGGGSSSTRPPSHPERPLSIVDESWETLDPHPDVRAMFLEFNEHFFWGKLFGVEVKWSPRMTLCAGLCMYEGRGGLCSIKLSEPLLKLRPRRDLVQTLLHEMIHALLFVTQNNRDRDGHGPEFCKHMDRINQASGTSITVYHSFHDEVDMYRQHWWRCDGPCQTRKPYFGFVKRAMNRAPSSQDPWWAEHHRTCGGSYTKVKEPDGYGKKNKKSDKKAGSEKNTDKKETSSSALKGSGLQDIRNMIPFSGTGFLLGRASKPSSSNQKPPDSILTKPFLSIDSSPPPPRTRDLGYPVQPGVRSLLSGTSSALSSITQGASGDKRPPLKRSVANTSVFVNIDGSPVRIPKPAKSSSRGTSASRTFSDRSSGLTSSQTSLQDFFNARGASSSSSISKPPAEGAREVSSPGRRQTDTSSLDSRGQANRSSGFPTRSKLGSAGYKLPSGRPTTSVPSPTTSVPSPTTSLPSPTTSPPSPTTSLPNPTTSPPSPTTSDFLPPLSDIFREPSVATKPGGSADGGPASRKRSRDDPISTHVFDFFQNPERRGSAAARDRSSPSGDGTPASSSLTTISSSSGPYNAPATSSTALLTVSCPVCLIKVQESNINEHLDSCLF